MKFVLFVMLVAFSASAFAGLPAGVILKGGEPSWTYWCGEFLVIEDVKNIEKYLREEHPNYFESAIFQDGIITPQPAEPITKFRTFNRSGVPEVIFKAGPPTGKARYEFAWATARGDISYAISGEGVHAVSDENLIAAILKGATLLISADHKFMSLCRTYSKSASFIKVDTFLESLEAPIDELVDQVKSCEDLLLPMEYRPLH